MKSSHIPKKAPSFTYPVQLLEKISSSANDLWDDYFGGLPYCTASALRRVLVCAACTRPGRRPPCSVFSMEHPVRWIMAHPEFRTDIYSFIHSPHMLNFCYFWIHKLSSYPNVRSGIHPTALSVPPFMKKKEEKGQVHRTYEVKKEKKKKKKKRKEKKTTVLGPKCSLPCINSMALPQGDTSIYCDRDCIKHCWSQPNQCTVLMRDRGRGGTRPGPGKEICLFFYRLTISPPSMAGYLSMAC